MTITDRSLHPTKPFQLLDIFKQFYEYLTKSEHKIRAKKYLISNREFLEKETKHS